MQQRHMPTRNCLACDKYLAGMLRGSALHQRGDLLQYLLPHRQPCFQKACRAKP